MTDLIRSRKRSLSLQQRSSLNEVPPEIEWLANITNPKTRRAYQNDVQEFSDFMGIQTSAELRTIDRAHVIAWRKELEHSNLAPSSIRRKLSALSSLFDYLCERNSIFGNPVDGVKRPAANGNEGSTPALGDAQVRRLLEAPSEETLKGKRDRAILARGTQPQFSFPNKISPPESTTSPLNTVHYRPPECYLLGRNGHSRPNPRQSSKFPAFHRPPNR